MHAFTEWNRQVTRSLLRAVKKQLRGFTFDTEGVDLVETLIDLDHALDGGAPVAVGLDELDVLLLPEQGSGGRHAASRLGNLVFDNLVVMGTVQRFHRSVHEFKNWQTVECPADLSWADGVTYFFGPLRDVAEGPRVEWLDRASATPRLFADEIEPAIGLRPYFWGQLRSKLEGFVRSDPSGSRLAGTELLRRTLATLVSEDSFLNHVMEDGESLTSAERRRRDLLSVDERRILMHFATTPRPGSALSVIEAERIGGREAVDELIDRAYLNLDEAQGRLSIAVRIYEDFLRSKLSVLREVAPDGPAPAARARPAADPRSVPPPRAERRPGESRPAEPRPADTGPVTTRPDAPRDRTARRRTVGPVGPPASSPGSTSSAAGASTSGAASGSATRSSRPTAAAPSSASSRGLVAAVGRRHVAVASSSIGWLHRIAFRPAGLVAPDAIGHPRHRRRARRRSPRRRARCVRVWAAANRRRRSCGGSRSSCARSWRSATPFRSPRPAR